MHYRIVLYFLVVHLHCVIKIFRKNVGSCDVYMAILRKNVWEKLGWIELSKYNKIPQHETQKYDVWNFKNSWKMSWPKRISRRYWGTDEYDAFRERKNFELHGRISFLVSDIISSLLRLYCDCVFVGCWGTSNLCADIQKT